MPASCNARSAGCTSGVRVQLSHRRGNGGDDIVVDDGTVQPAQGFRGDLGEGPVATQRGQGEPVAQQPGEPHRH